MIEWEGVGLAGVGAGEAEALEVGTWETCAEDCGGVFRAVWDALMGRFEPRVGCGEES